ncbi:hypothetical protein IPZ58_16765 [Streptomyces roseoverticillatus]|uniref:hypothetical protein n=1 Tax=Streptomyces roseoverticillatus TaxID=66429 RepID=UPI001F36B711|nr:hypothetical protein [Streptomyces roseoverticillatus]MCF3103219.1 hypothetical protein [Streptomyces roseoverticillatus]
MTSSFRPPQGRLLAAVGIGVGLLAMAASTAPAAALTAPAPAPAPPEPSRAPFIGQAVSVTCDAFGPTLFVRLPSQLSSVPSAVTPELKGFPDCLRGMNPSGG